MSEPVAEKTDGPITTLPDSLILEIFKYLNVRELGITAGVCKHWHMLSHDPVLRRCIDVTFLPLSAIRIWYLLRSQMTPSVKELHIRGCFVYRCLWGSHASSFHSVSPSFNSFTLPELCHRCPALRNLFLSDMAFALDTNGQVPTLAHFPPTLKCLGMRGCLFNPTSFFSNDPTQLVTRLCFLDLSTCIRVDALVLRHLETRARSLRALGLERCIRIEHELVLCLDRILENLTRLDLEGTGLDDRGLAHVLRRGQSLQMLFVGNTSVTGRPWAPLPRGWLLELRRLCIRNTAVHLGDLVRVARAAPALQSLIVSAADFSAAKELDELCRVMPTCDVVRCTLLADETCGHFAEAAVRRCSACF